MKGKKEAAETRHREGGLAKFPLGRTFERVGKSKVVGNEEAAVREAASGGARTRERVGEGNFTWSRPPCLSNVTKE